MVKEEATYNKQHLKVMLHLPSKQILLCHFFKTKSNTMRHTTLISDLMRIHRNGSQGPTKTPFLDTSTPNVNNNKTIYFATFNLSIFKI